MAGKICSACKAERGLTDFYKDKSKRDGKSSSCKKCVKARNKAWVKANPKKRKAHAKKWANENRTRAPREIERDREYKRHYGISLQEVEQMWAEQGGRCAICNVPEELAPKNRLHVDHEHSTGTVRALLCHHCNTGLGKFKDSPELLGKAITYLRTHNG